MLGQEFTQEEISPIGFDIDENKTEKLSEKKIEKPVKVEQAKASSGKLTIDYHNNKVLVKGYIYPITLIDNHLNEFVISKDGIYFLDDKFDMNFVKIKK